MNIQYSGNGLQPAMNSASQACAPKVRGIYDIITEIANEISESVNSSSNLADKLGGAEPCDPSVKIPEPVSICAKLDLILDGVRVVNGHLNRSHRAVNG